MSWVSDSKLTWTQRLAVNVLQCGPIPNHVAFIMDGNRRFAAKNNLKSKNEGHVKGFDRLSLALKWCLDIGIKEVTVYAFSIENFKRSKEEVDTLLGLVREKLIQLKEEEDKLNERGIRIQIIGNLSLLPIDIQQLMADAVLMTKDNNKAILNVAFAYTARDEITESVKTIVNGVKNGDLHPEDINEKLIRSCMYTRHSPDPDLLVRTSGEARLSDFLLSQISTTIIYFSNILWPEFTFWNLLTAVFYFQRNYERMQKARKLLNQYQRKSHYQSTSRIVTFLEKLDAEEMNFLKSLTLNPREI